MKAYMRALIEARAGLLSVTVWNKEEPPKSTGAAVSMPPWPLPRAMSAAWTSGRIRSISLDLSTATVLYTRGGFTADEIAKLQAPHQGL